MIFGVLGPLVVLVHSGTHFHALVPIAAMLTMGVVVVSGIVGQALHYLAFREVNDHRRELVAQGLSETDIEAQVHALARHEETLRLWQCIHGPMTAVFVVLVLMHIGRALYSGGCDEMQGLRASGVSFGAGVGLGDRRLGGMGVGP